jgi:hypothetical protein
VVRATVRGAVFRATVFWADSIIMFKARIFQSSFTSR